MPSPTAAETTATTKPTTPIPHTIPIPAPPTSETEPDISKDTTAHPDMDPPTFPQQITHTVLTNTEILADTDHFNTHIFRLKYLSFLIYINLTTKGNHPMYGQGDSMNFSQGILNFFF